MRTVVGAFFRGASDFLGIPGFFGFKVGSDTAAGVESWGCRHTLITGEIGTYLPYLSPRIRRYIPYINV